MHSPLADGEGFIIKDNAFSKYPPMTARKGCRQEFKQSRRERSNVGRQRQKKSRAGYEGRDGKREVRQRGISSNLIHDRSRPS